MSMISWSSSPNKYMNRNHTSMDQAWKANGTRRGKEAGMNTNAQGTSTSDSYEI
ncbi:hypothetical protein HanXRQr2_Chr01g0000731 [Helianthus annuus]|uniref:Uncharacterized protein n=1 Tax=Helianthus annuus TaxID=4232 RepID=A0A9K3JS78_HELAN|nr:hypothetical protein HanXRQr2_Chr01g0000731 [Helianthus annuus]